MLHEFVNEVKNIAHEAVDGVHTAFPAKIVSFDATKGLATVLPLIKYRKPDGDLIDYPQIFGVPVLFPQALGQLAYIVFPVNAGDLCLCIVSEQALDLWMYEQETATDLRHDITNAICIPGLFAKANGALTEAISNRAIVVGVGDTKITVKESGITLSGDVYIDGTLHHENNS